MYKYMDIVEKLKSDFAKLPPDSKVSSRASLCRRFNISRYTADRVMETLGKEKIIYAKVGSGSYISSEFSSAARQNSRTVKAWGLIMPNIMTNSFPGILRGVEDVAQSLGINTIVCNTDYDAAREHEYITRLIDSRVSGVIIIPQIYAHMGITGYQMLIDNNIQCVFCNRGVDELSFVPIVSCNNYYGGYLATKHLIDTGYKHVGFLSAIRFQTSLDRLSGFCAAHMDANIPIDYDIVVPQVDTANENDVHNTVFELLSKENRPDALFCHNDIIASQVYQVAKECCLRIPEDLGLIGFDNNVEVALTVSPSLTSVSYRDYDVGCMAATLLNKIVEGDLQNCSKVFLLQPSLVVRESCLGPDGP